MLALGTPVRCAASGSVYRPTSRRSVLTTRSSFPGITPPRIMEPVYPRCNSVRDNYDGTISSAGAPANPPPLGRRPPSTVQMELAPSPTIGASSEVTRDGLPADDPQRRLFHGTSR